MRRILGSVKYLRLDHKAYLVTPRRAPGLRMAALVLCVAAMFISPGMARSAASPVIACLTPLSLTLRAGFTIPGDTTTRTTNPDIPPGDVTVHLPLHPDAVPTSETLLHPSDGGVPLSYYLKGATAEYLLPIDWYAAEGWYRDAFAACGFQVLSDGASSDPSGTTSRWLTFVSSAPPALQVNLVFEQDPAGHTLMLYVAFTEALPPPPILVPGSPNALTVLAYRPLSPGQLAAATPTSYVQVHDAATIQALVDHLNHLRVPSGATSCPLDNGSHDDLRFTYPDGHALMVEVQTTGCRLVRAGKQVAWSLGNQQLFTLLDSLLSSPNTVHLGWPFDAKTLRLADRQAVTGDGNARFLAWDTPSRYLEQDRGGLWLVGGGSRRQVASGSVAQAVFNPAGDVLYRSVSHGSLGPLTLFTRTGQRSQVTWAPHGRIVGTQAGLGSAIWSNGMTMCDMDVWFVQGSRLVGIDPYHRDDTYHPAIHLPPLTPSTRLAVSCDGSLAAISTGSRIEIRDLQSGRLYRHFSAPSPVTLLSWDTANRDILAYAAGGLLEDVDAPGGERQTLVDLRGATVHGMTWDPYGHALAYALRAAGGSRIDVVNEDGSGHRVLDRQTGGLTAPVWDPSGTSIAYTRHVSGHSNVWIDRLSVPKPYPPR